MNPPVIHDSDELAAALRADPPPLDDLSRARMERRILAGPSVAPAQQASGNGRALAFGGTVIALAVAAAVALVVLADRDPGAETIFDGAPVARFEVHEVQDSARRGTLEEGSVLPTGPTEEADIRIADSRVRILSSSRVRIAELAPGRVGLDLSTGAVEVHFHPRARGREHLSVVTPEARVEVVGTVFTVRRTAGATEVRVREGVVRVVSLHDGSAVRVAAGEHTRVEAGGSPQQASAQVATQPAQPVAAVVSEPTLAPDVEAEHPSPTVLAEASPRAQARTIEPAAEASRRRAHPARSTSGRSEPRSPTASASDELARARELLASGDAQRAEPILRSLTSRGSSGVRVQAHTLLADLERLSGRLPEAQRSYAEAARLGAGTPGGANAIYALARLQERQLRQRNPARASYRRYLTEAPGGPLAAQAQAALCRLGESAECP